jgi:hypothetical protein
MKNRFERSGDIREVDLLAALVALWRQKSSVTLDFTRTGATGGFDISDGDIVATFSADPRFENAAILVRAGKLEPAALERLAAPEGSDRSMAAMQAGVLTRREWKWGEKIRAIEVLSDLLTWNDGRYLAEPDTRSISGEFRLPIPRLVLELFLRSRDRALVDHQLGSPDAPLERSEDFEKEFSTFGLTADAESVVRLIDGQATARQISAKAPADAFAVEKLLAALVTLGLLRPSGEEGSAPSETPGSASPLEPEPAPAAERDALDVEIEGTAAEPPQVSAAFASLPDFPEPAEERVPEPEAMPELESAAPYSSLEASDRFDAETIDAGPVAAELPVSGAAEWDTLAPGPPDPILERTVEPEAERSGTRQGPILLAVFAALAVAVAAVLVFKSWPGATKPVPPERTAVAAAPTAASEAPKPTEAPPPTIPAPRPTAARAKAVPAATVAPVKPTVAPAPIKSAATKPARPVPTAGRAAAPAGPERKPWLDRAESDRRRLAAERGAGTRYAVQLLLACEVPTLADAWRHDQPAGSLWLQTTDHRGRTCFRVLWGRFATADEARLAKDRVPGYFVTPSNRPAVVAVR